MSILDQQWLIGCIGVSKKDHKRRRLLSPYMTIVKKDLFNVLRIASVNVSILAVWTNKGSIYCERHHLKFDLFFVENLHINSNNIRAHVAGILHDVMSGF